MGGGVGDWKVYLVLIVVFADEFVGVSGTPGTAAEARRCKKQRLLESEDSFSRCCT